jgi:hypothetical protein
LLAGRVVDCVDFSCWCCGDDDMVEGHAFDRTIQHRSARTGNR